MFETYVITFYVRPTERGRFLTLLNSVLYEMRHEPTFKHAALHVDPNNENRFQLHETWENRNDVIEVQLRRDYRITWHQALDEILERPRDIAIWSQQRADWNPTQRVLGS